MGTEYGNRSIVTSGLTLCLDAGNLKSYPTSGTTWTDLTRNGNNGTLIANPVFTNNSISLNGSTQYVNFGNILNLSTNSLTVNMWVNLNSIVGQTFLSKALAGVQNYRFSMGVPSTGTLGIFIQGNGGADITPNTSVILSANTWFMATFVLDRSSSAKIYYNAVSQTLINSATISQWNGLDFQSSNPFRIGTYTASDNTSPVSLTNGRIGLVQVYFRVLSDSEILQNYNATKWRFQ